MSDLPQGPNPELLKIDDIAWAEKMRSQITPPELERLYEAHQAQSIAERAFARAIEVYGGDSDEARQARAEHERAQESSRRLTGEE